MPRLFAHLAYDGSKFDGFAPQPRPIPTVMASLEQAFGKLGIFAPITAAGRTDKGVHATKQVISLAIDPHWLGRFDYLAAKVNDTLHPQGAHIFNLRLVKEDFHPRFWAKQRTYRYILSDKKPSIFAYPYITYLPSLDHDAIIQSIPLFEGRHNFEYFAKQDDQTQHAWRTIHKATAYQYHDLLVCQFTADAYLRNQIRRMVGFLIAISDQKVTPQMLIAQRDGKALFFSKPAPPNGLYLSHIAYDQEIFL